MRKKYIDQAKKIIQSYLDGDDLSYEESHVLHDCAAEYGQILDNVIKTDFFNKALAENLEALDCFKKDVL